MTSLSLFVVAKNYVNDRRQENMKARERMRRSNEGEYPDVYRKLWAYSDPLINLIAKKYKNGGATAGPC